MSPFVNNIENAVLRRVLRCAAGTLLATVALLITTGALASGTSFAPIPGATYTGNVGHGTVSITVSADGTLVSAYSFVGISGTNSKGGGCTIGSDASTPAWGGAPITGGSFEYSQPSSFDLTGTFSGAQAASGTVTFTVGSFTSSDGCSTHPIQWNAITTSAPPSPGNGNGNGNPGGGTGATPSAGTPGGSTAGNTNRKSLAVRVSLKRRSAPKPKGRSKAKSKARASLELAGSLKSSNRGCTGKRTVYLWHGRKRVGTAHSTSKGTFTFKAAKSLHNKPVRATVKAMSTSKLACAAASSTYIRD